MGLNSRKKYTHILEKIYNGKMKKINYALIVSDFDGTLLRSDGTIAEQTKEKIRRYVADGGKFAISTGRIPVCILSQLQALGLTGAVACSQGASIVDIESGKMLLDGRLDNEKAIAVCKKMEEMGLHIHVYEPWAYYSNMRNKAFADYEQIVQVKGVVIDDKPMSQFLQESGCEPSKITALVAPKDREWVCKELTKTFASPSCYVTSSAKTLVEIGNNAYTKGTSVQFLADYYGISMDKTIGIGDQQNDLAMVQAAGLGFAVKNADMQLQKHAQVYPLSNDEDAIGAIIEEFGYTKD